MDQIAKTPLAPPKRRWWKRVVAGLIVLFVALVAFLPQILNTEFSRAWLLDRANRTLNPGRLDVARFRFSWFRPTELDGLVVRDAQGEKVVDCQQAVWDRNLFQALFKRPRYGKLSLPGAILDIERADDGSIDLVEALRPILDGPPPAELTIEIAEGSLRVRSPGLAEPIEASSFDLMIRRPAAPGRVTWDGALRDEDGRSLVITGSYDRWDQAPAGKNGLTIEFLASKWPLHVTVQGVSIRVGLDGRFGAKRETVIGTDARWSTDGKARLLALEMSGEALSGDRLRLDELAGSWSLNRTDRGWAIAGLDLRSPVGSLLASGTIPGDSVISNRIVGTLDLAALATQLPRTLRLKEGLRLDRGTAELSIDVEPRPDQRLWSATAGIHDVAAHLGETKIIMRDPFKLSAKVFEREGSLTVESVAVESAFLNAEGRGNLDSGVRLAGKLDLAALTGQVANFIDLGTFQISGSGPFAADLKREATGYVGTIEATFPEASLGPDRDALRLEGLSIRARARGGTGTFFSDERLEIGLDSASRAGLSLGKTRVVGHSEGESFRFEPIETTLNGGRLRLVPQLVREPELMLKLGPGSELVDAEVNEEATRRVLSFVAPILEGTTRARGRVSARIDRAELPLGANARKKAVVEGNVVFQDVVFAPGPFAATVLELIGRSDATLRLDQPVVLSISDGRVHQRGLAVPVGNLTKIEIEGSVGFDRSLDLRTTLPLTSAMFPNNAALADVVGGLSISVSIRGTLDRPQIDKDAFRAGLADMGKGFLLRGATRGASELLFRLARPRDPNAPPPLTPEERKALRIEKRMQKRAGG
ncbi:MAG: hypothetical protein JWN86_2313 [Planctomycetota bacterium]|nr:hypothetical protein [Planctomycetota bacterium]